MKCQLFVPLLLVFSLTSIAWSGAGAQDAKQIQGTWVPLSAELGGKALPDDVRKSIKLVLKADTYVVTAGKEPDEGKCKIDPTKTPKTLDITGTKGPNMGKTFPCIYELNGDTLRVCYDLSGKARPTEFKTTEGSMLFLVTYRREK
jgi:uncharacterized protein (TIGR03067 family)